ncbi:MAG: hypothetical protein RIT45_2941, partial [Pseudomonadota bacterium]
MARARPSVEQRLIDALHDESAALRVVAARAMAASRSEQAVDALLSRLKPDVERDDAALSAAIVALAAIGTDRAEEPVDAARRRAGQWSTVWQATRAAYAMIPPAVVPPEREGDADAWVDRGDILALEGQLDAAEKHYDRAIALNPKLARAYTNRGMLQRRRGALRAVITDHDRALALEPELGAALANRAVAHGERRDVASALADSRALVALGGSLKTLGLRGVALTASRGGDRATATEAMDLALAADPKGTRTLVIALRVAAYGGALDAATSLAERGLRIDRRDPDLLVWRAERRRLAGDLRGARADLDAAVLRSDRIGIRRARVALLAASGEAGAGRLDLDVIVEAAPDEAESYLSRANYGPSVGLDVADALADIEAALRLATPKERSRVAILAAGVRRLHGRPGAASGAGAGEIPLHDALLAAARGGAAAADPQLLRTIHRRDDRSLAEVAFALAKRPALLTEAWPEAAREPDAFAPPECELA